MKIKTVCELTGLSDRTIRYYIEQNLISPSYTENYLGRRTYTFSQKDIDELNNIAVLRKFGFTIEEIRDIIDDAQTSKTILCDVRNRTENAVLDGQQKLLALSQISIEKTYTLAELAEELSKSSSVLPVQNETIKRNPIKIIFAVLKSVLIFIIVWLPVAIQTLFCWVTFLFYTYPVFYPESIAFMILSILPSFLLFIIGKIKIPWKRIVRIVLLLFCLISILCSSFVFMLPCGIMAKSQTADFRNYRNFDADCLANRDIVFQELFPIWPHYFENVKQADGSYETVYLDAHYYYHYATFMDYTYDIYAEWPLDEKAFYEEVERATNVFKSYDFTKLTKGDYECLILYSGSEPFNRATENYDYLIFAYNEKSKTVRYICCTSLEDGADQPYYLQLDW